MRKSGFVILILSGVVLVGCSSSGSSKAKFTPGSINPETASTAVKQTADPCKLFTAADASKLAGGVVMTRSSGSAGTLLCVYKSGTTASEQITVKLAADATAAHAEFPTWVHPFAGATSNVKTTTIPNLGDEASATRDTTINSGIYVRKGPWLIKIGGHPAATNAQLRVAANAALGRL